MPVAEKRKGLKEQKVKITFDVGMLNSLVKYLRCEYISAQNKANLYRLIKSLDLDSYRYNQEVYMRLELIQSMLRALLDENLTDEGLIRSYVVSNMLDADALIDNIGFSKNTLSSTECEYISKSVIERVQYLEIYRVREDIIKLLENLDNSSYEVSYYSMIQELKDKLSSLMGNLQSPVANVGLIRELSFSDSNFGQLIDLIVQKRKKPSSVLQTGIRQLNALLAPGFQSGRLYCIVGGSGKFKSGTLLNLVEQIRQFNPHINPFENGLRKCILFVTLENSIEETVERLYDMYSGVNDDLRNCDTAEVIQLLRDKGNFTFTSESGIDLYMEYYSNLEIDTSAIYGIVKKLHDRGKEPICVVLDYIKRINSAHPNGGDERTRMSFVSKELKSIAQFYEIPVITAMQLNREGNSIIDAAMRENKQDVARFVGSSSIGNAWDIIEDSDWVGLINLEVQKSTGQLFLTFKRLKIRGKSELHTVDYFNHPFVNEKNIRLQHDVDKDGPVSIISLASDLESIVEKEELKSMRAERPRVTNIRSDHFENRVLAQLPSIPLDSLT